jgi:HTH-type transcriptional regulator/antitoxin HigA
MLAVSEVVTHYVALKKLVPLEPLVSERQYKKAVQVLEQLLDAGGADEKNPLAPLVATLGELIGNYEGRHQKADTLTPVQVLKFLMQQHGLRQSDLPEIGSQGVVSEILSGKRDLTMRHVYALAERFGVSPRTFVA